MAKLKMLFIATTIYTACYFIAVQFLKPHPAWAVLLGLFIGAGTVKAYSYLKGEDK